jgi:choline dehydrogenase-like flavoprotein
MWPQSRGVIRLAGPDPADPLKFNPNYLGDPQDLKDLNAGLDMAREIGNSSSLRPSRDAIRRLGAAQIGRERGSIWLPKKKISR